MLAQIGSFNRLGIAYRVLSNSWVGKFPALNQVGNKPSWLDFFAAYYATKDALMSLDRNLPNAPKRSCTRDLKISPVTILVLSSALLRLQRMIDRLLALVLRGLIAKFSGVHSRLNIRRGHTTVKPSLANVFDQFSTLPSEHSHQDERYCKIMEE